MTRNLWPHQVRCIAMVNEAIKSGFRCPLIVMGTGSGKTVTAVTMVATHVATPGRAVLWLVHREELVDQASNELKTAGLHVGKICSGVSHDPSAVVQVATIQTLIARGYWPPATAVFVDEAHHLTLGNTWGEFVAHYKTAIIVGLTATPGRGDGSALDVFDRLIVPTSVRELTEAGFLVPCEIISTKKPLGPGKIAARPVDLWQQHAKGLKTIVFASHAVAAEEFLADFLAAGVRAAFVHHKSPDRAEIIADFKGGKIDVLINLAILTEGFDCPEVECIILGRTCGSLSLYLQMIGRGLRACYNKQRCILLDPTGQVHVHGKPDEEFVYSLHGKGIRRKGVAVLERFCAVCGVLVDPDALVCPGCGTVKPALVAPKVTGDVMSRFEWIRKQTPEFKKRHWMKMILEAAAKGQKPGAAWWKYKSTYGEEPPTR